MNARLAIPIVLMILTSAFIVPTISISIKYTSISGEVEPLYNLTKWTIPDNLPWYPVVVIGDNRPSDTDAVDPPRVFVEIVNEASLIHPIAFIGTGDHVGKGTREQYEKLYQILKNSGLQNIWLALGNHDLELHGESMNNWLTYVGPEYSYIDDVPSWRIALINSETRLSIYWKNQILNAYKDLGNRTLIFVFHRPIYPKVQHNLGLERSNIFMNIVKEKDNVKLVLQGHYHGWGMQIKNNITWIITGGAGAPLYSYANDIIQPDLEIINFKHHYLVLILYPNQTFKYIPVMAGPGSGELEIKKINETAFMIYNSKKTIYNTSAHLPVRLTYNLSIGTLYVQIIADPNSRIIVNLDDTGKEYIVRTNTTNWYAYLYNETNPEQASVYEPQHNIIEIKYAPPINTSTTTSESITTTTTTTATATPPTTMTTSTTTAGEEKGLEQHLLYIAVLVIVAVLGIAGYILFKK